MIEPSRPVFISSSFIPGSSTQPTSTIEIAVACRNLLDCDVFTKSDPMCVISFKTPESPEWREIFRTEKIDNDLNPNFAKKLVMTYHFETVQELKFSIYDVDSDERSALSNHDFLGECYATVGEIVSAKNFKRPLKGGKRNNQGMLLVQVDELSDCKDEVFLKFRGENLKRDDWSGWLCTFFRRINPILELSRVNEEGGYTVVHRTEFVRWTSNPSWKPFTVPLRALCGGDPERTIRIACYDSSNRGQTLLGESQCTLSQLKKGQCLDNEFHLKKRSNRSSTPTVNGKIILERIAVEQVYTFLDYIKGGLQLNCTIAIDFTSSNGDPSTPESLHYITNNGLNQYEKAIIAVGQIIKDYDSDQLFPILGFGARVPPDGKVSHEFFVNMNPSNPFVPYDGILDSYRKCLRSVQLYGPTNFSPVIRHVANFGKTYQGELSQYFILLILTDGVITDMELTKKAIVEASSLPLSIIIVGVGNADFRAMDELDGDSVPLEYNGIKVARDIVQFVPFRNFLNIRQSEAQASAFLAREVLAEIPEQVVSYMKSMKYKPGNR